MPQSNGIAERSGQGSGQSRDGVSAMTAETGRLGLDFRILAWRDHARHSSHVLRDMGVVALQDDPFPDPCKLALGNNEAAQAGNDAAKVPRRLSEEVEKHVAAAFAKPTIPAYGGDARRFPRTYESRRDHAKDYPGAFAGKATAKRIQSVQNIDEHWNLLSFARQAGVENNCQGDDTKRSNSNFDQT